MSERSEVPGQVPRPLAIVFTTVGFFALTIAGLGMASLLTDSEVIAIPGLGPLPGAIGVAAAGAAFAGVTWIVLRPPRPSFTGVLWTTVATYLAYGIVTGVAALFATSGIATSLAVIGELLVGWPGLVVAGAALVCGWSAVALVRTRAGRPRWPWERDDEE